MADQELVLAISKLMDDKLEPIKSNIQGVKDEVQGIRDEVQGLGDGLQRVSDELQRIKEKVRVLEWNVQVLNDRVRRIEWNVQVLNDRVQRIELAQESEILPRLQNIEKCYLDTYKRYQSGADQIETMQEDISVLKKVVVEHSLKMQKYSNNFSQKVIDNSF